MSLCSMSTTQMPTPPMTQAELKRERRHQCDDDRSMLPSEALSPSFEDWILFPVEGSPLAEPTPRSTPVRESAKTRKPQQEKAQHETNATNRKRRNHPKLDQVIRFDVNLTPKSNSVKSMKSRKSTSTSNAGKKTEKPESPTIQVPGFEKVPRIEGPIPMLGRCPTPPIEEMREPFAPIEALGEDLRWYRTTRSR